MPHSDAATAKAGMVEDWNTGNWILETWKSREGAFSQCVSEPLGFRPTTHPCGQAAAIQAEQDMQSALEGNGQRPVRAIRMY